MMFAAMKVLGLVADCTSDIDFIEFHAALGWLCGNFTRYFPMSEAMRYQFRYYIFSFIIFSFLLRQSFFSAAAAAAVHATRLASQEFFYMKSSLCSSCSGEIEMKILLQSAVLNLFHSYMVRCLCCYC
jgi:hypothetical protein